MHFTLSAEQRSATFISDTERRRLSHLYGHDGRFEHPCPGRGRDPGQSRQAHGQLAAGHAVGRGERRHAYDGAVVHRLPQRHVDLHQGRGDVSRAERRRRRPRAAGQHAVRPDGERRVVGRGRRIHQKVSGRAILAFYFIDEESLMTKPDIALPSAA